MLMKTLKSVFAILLVMVICLSVGVPAFAASGENEVLSGEEVAELLETEGATLDIGKLSAGLRTRSAASMSGTLYVKWYTFDNVGYLESIGTTVSGNPAKQIKVGGKFKTAYCVAPHAGTSNGLTYGSTAAEVYNKLTAAQKSIIGDIIACGFNYELGYQFPDPNTSNTNVASRNEGRSYHYKWAITQILVWAAVNNKITRADGVTKFAPIVTQDMEKLASHCKWATYKEFTEYYYALASKIQNLRKIPSFASADDKSASKKGKIIFLNEENEGSKQFLAKREDKNNVLANFDFSFAASSGITTKKNGNELTIASDAELPGPVVSQKATREVSGGEGACTYWQCGSYQPLATWYQYKDPVNAYIAVKTGDGTVIKKVGIIKTSEDGIVAGIPFTITGNGKTYNRTTDADGVISVSDLPIYKKVPMLDEEGNPVVDEETGEEVMQNGDPIIYTATENTPIRYVKPASQSFTLAGGDVTLHFENRLKKWRVTVKKHDSEMGNVSQGDASRTGAMYGLYKDGTLLTTYITDYNSSFTTDYYPCGSGYELREISPSEGYLLNEASYKVGMTPGETTIEYNDTSKTVTEQVKKNYIEIFKHKSADVSTDTETDTPEVGAVFQVYLTAAGSYESAKETERDTITTDERGLAHTKMLPYGRYTVHQVSGAEGFAMIPDFEIFISDQYAEDAGGEGQDNRYFVGVDNAVIRALVKIVKKDAETGRVIPVSGIGFRVKNLDTGEYVVQHINYPEQMDVEVYYTNVTGTLMLPYELPYGRYQIEEVQTAHGYILNTEPVEFTVDGTLKEVVVEKNNKPQKGIIHVEKQGEVFSTVKKNGEVYEPVYEVKGLAGAEYEIRAAEDVRTPDGTLRYSKGELVDTVTTAEEGKASSKELYLGEYTVTETKAPEGMVLNTESHTVTLSYAGQEAEVTETHTGFVNERQKVEVDLKKSLEQDTDYKIGMNGEEQNVVFGLYTAEELTAADGSAIPADGLVGLAAVSGGRAVFGADVPFGKYYVKEYSTDAHYIISSRKYPLEFSYAGQDVEVVSLHANDGGTVHNELIRGRVIGAKFDGDGITLGGALMGIFAPGTTEYTKDTAIDMDTSNTDGSFVFEDVPYGDWIIHEIASPTGFILSEEFFPVSISSDGEVVTVNVRNDFILGNVRLVKLDRDYPDRKLSGAEFEIYEDMNGNGVYDKDDDKLVGTLEEGEEGVYGYEGLRYGDYFVVEAKAPEGYKADKNAYPVQIREDGEVVEVRNSAEGFINAPEEGKLRLTKKDVATGEVIPNAGFTIKDKDGKVVVKGRTDKSGVAEFVLRLGKYTYQEYDAPKGYILDETPHPFEIKEDGEIVKAVMTNKSVPVTGDEDTRDGLMAALLAMATCAVGLGCMGVVRLFRHRRRRVE